MAGRRWRTVRCTAMVTGTATGRRCANEAVLGSDPPRCERHPVKAGIDPHLHTELYMSKFYRNVLKPTLANRIGEMLEATTLAERLDVGEELALVRDAASHRVDLYGSLVEAQAAGAPVTIENLVAAGQVMTEALVDVAKLVKVHAEVERVKAEVVSGFAGCLDAVILSVLRAAHQAFGDDCRVRQFEEILREELRTRQSIGVGAALGTDSLPSDDVAEMDASVPREGNGEAVMPDGSPGVTFPAPELVGSTGPDAPGDGVVGDEDDDSGVEFG